MKTCATCRHYNHLAEHCKANKFYLPPSGKGILMCEKYDQKREPLRLECECEWVSEFHIDHPVGEQMREKLAPFIGKKTKMTLEEICD